MNFSSNLKDTLTTIAAVLATIVGAIFTLQSQGLTLPSWVNTVSIVAGSIAAVITMLLTGKLPNGKTKPEEVVVAANKTAAVAVAAEGKSVADAAVVDAQKPPAPPKV